MIYQLLIISSTEGNSLDALSEQISYIEQFVIEISLLIDPDELEILKILDQHYYNGAYIHIKRRINSSYNIVKLLESHQIPIIGNHYITQLLIGDKCLTSLKSGIGLPCMMLTRKEYDLDHIPYDKIKKDVKYPVIVKPNSLHASQGISSKSVAFYENELYQIIKSVFERFTFLEEVLIEHFSQNGTEYAVSVLGNGNSLACCVNKISYTNYNIVNLYSEEEKKLPLEQRNMSFLCEPDDYIHTRLEFHAKALFKHFNLKDFARFDMMYDKTFYLLEANCCPIPGNSYSWEWQEKYGLQKQQVLALYLCSFHFGQIASGRADNLPQKLINDLPQEIIYMINHPDAIDVCPECSGPTENCLHPELYSMNSRVGSETEVSHFLESIVNIIKPHFVIETGTYQGDGTIALAEGLRKNNFGHMISIEIDSQLAAIATKKTIGYPVKIICGNSLDYIPPEQIDLLFLDSKRILRKEEFKHFMPFLHNKSLIVWHDSSYRKQNHAVYDAVNELYADGIIDRILLPTPRGITLSMLKEVI